MGEKGVLEAPRVQSTLECAPGLPHLRRFDPYRAERSTLMYNGCLAGIPREFAVLSDLNGATPFLLKMCRSANGFVPCFAILCRSAHSHVPWANVHTAVLSVPCREYRSAHGVAPCSNVSQCPRLCSVRQCLDGGLLRTVLRAPPCPRLCFVLQCAAVTTIMFRAPRLTRWFDPHRVESAAVPTVLLRALMCRSAHGYVPRVPQCLQLCSALRCAAVPTVMFRSPRLTRRFDPYPLLLATMCRSAHSNAPSSYYLLWVDGGHHVFRGGCIRSGL